MKIKFNRKILKAEYLIFEVLWLIILLPKPIQLMVTMSIGILLCLKEKLEIRRNSVAIAMFILFGIHIFSILYNMLVNQYDTSRIFAAINTATLWFVAAFFYQYYSERKNNINFKTIGKCCIFNIVILFILGIISMYIYKKTSIDGYFFMGKMLYSTTYLDGVPKIKFIGLNDFSNMNLFFIMLMLMLAYPYLKKKNKIFQVYVIALASFCVFIIHSRS